MRIKRGLVKKRRHNKILKATKGFRMSYSRLYRRALEAFKHAGTYSYGHRRHRRAQMRVNWIRMVAAGLVSHQVSYNAFVAGLRKHNIALNRKVLAEIAQSNPEHFAEIVKVAMA
jgi:large subunit ribosomal protein L20